MISKLRELVSGWLPDQEVSSQEAALDLTVAVLLVEMARADHHLDASEEAEICRQLQTGFGLDDVSARGLLERARHAAEDAVSLHEFTRVLHEGMDYSEKLRVVEMLWQVALADNDLDKYEDYLVGKVADLLYVSRGDVIRLRQQTLEKIGR